MVMQQSEIQQNIQTPLGDGVGANVGHMSTLFLGYQEQSEFQNKPNLLLISIK